MTLVPTTPPRAGLAERRCAQGEMSVFLFANDCVVSVTRDGSSRNPATRPRNRLLRAHIDHSRLRRSLRAFAALGFRSRTAHVVCSLSCTARAWSVRNREPVESHYSPPRP
eukprot:7137683-Prymnesium_polylepis.1